MACSVPECAQLGACCGFNFTLFLWCYVCVSVPLDLVSWSQWGAFCAWSDLGRCWTSRLLGSRTRLETALEVPQSSEQRFVGGLPGDVVRAGLEMPAFSSAMFARVHVCVEV